MRYTVEIPSWENKDFIHQDGHGNLRYKIPVQTNVRKHEIITDLVLTPYTEINRTQIENGVWNFASRLMNINADIMEDIYWSMNGGRGIGVAAELTYQEAKKRFDEWEQRKLDREQRIDVGDEVEYSVDDETTRFVVMDIIGDFAYGFKFPCEYDDVGEYCDIDDLRKTGRYFPDLVNLLKAMKGE